ncbi:hypothetical protein GIB67_004610 [Kingdonia uniflora]|uniref:Magnesium transporter n=1 Tax=Kingdonia uniflora TaxID=39325 RepID=A0A7J7MD32_9MAGN|nr:hypothetical protein GIB67_004610 [Kingdonia uniflora]
MRAQPPLRRKAAGTRPWLVISESGKSHFEEVGKHSIMRRTGLPARDLRILDPVFTYPSSILGRERAIVVNLEHIKAIITATEVLVLNSKDPLVAPFVCELELRVSNFGQSRPNATESSAADIKVTVKAARDSQPSQEVERSIAYPCQNSGGNSDAEIELIDKATRGSQPFQEVESSLAYPSQTGWTDVNSPGNRIDVAKAGGSKILPLEFKALEVCLEYACRCLETETSTLEQEAYPALDELTSKISTLNLERVRNMKSRLVALSGRVQKVRDELENLLDDDMDMAEMYLTDKLVHQQSEEIVSEDKIDDDNDVFDRDNESDNDLKSTKSSSADVTGFKPNVEELEMLLEAYFAEIEGTLNKLSTMREYVDDTEDYINIMLDDKQNQLLQMGVLLSTANLLLNAAIVVVGIFGMNITIDLFSSNQAKFMETTFGTTAGCVVLYIFAVYFGKKRGLLE